MDDSDDEEFNQQETGEVTVHSNNNNHNDGLGLSEGESTTIINNNDQPITKHSVAVSKSSTAEFSPGENVYESESINKNPILGCSCSGRGELVDMKKKENKYFFPF